MSDVTVTIASDGTPTPSDIQISPGDTVSFHADGANVVLCIDPAEYFGEERYAIPNGETVHLTMQADASGPFQYITLIGDLNADCYDGRDKRGGGGGNG